MSDISIISLVVPVFLTSLLSVGILLLVLRGWFKHLEDKSKPSQELMAWLKDIGRRIDHSSDSMDKKLAENMQVFNARLDTSARVIGNLQREIGEFSEIGKSMKQLQEFLQSPKLRGNIGEQVLKEILQQHFPHDSFELQYAFSSGEKVDAVLKTSHGLVPIDAKFPAENFRRLMDAGTEADRQSYRKEFVKDVRKHIQDIAKKYIVSDEETIDYALMYVPSEAVYYEIINNPDLFDFAGKKRVLPVSPMSFYAYLKAILMSFEGEKIQQQAKEILILLKSLQKDYEGSHEVLQVLTKHVTNASNQLASFTRSFQSLGQKLEATQRLSLQDKD